MPQSATPDMLSIPITGLTLPDNLKIVLSQNNYATLEEVLQLKADDILQLPGMNFHRIQELVLFLENNKLIKYFKE